MNFLDSAIEACGKNPELPSIMKVGFSGGEPFLYFDFIVDLTNYVIEHDMMFDQIMTNGHWWKDKNELETKLQVLYDAGYDGKIGLSWDIFHGQPTERMKTFIETVLNMFGQDSINIQTVIPHKKLFKADEHSADFINKKLYKAQLRDLAAVQKQYGITVYQLQQSFPCDHPLAWTGKKWFTEDYCEGPGHILYIHPTGDIAPCCGFANENPALFIGKITDNYETVMKNAEENKMINLCYIKGLLAHKEELEAQGHHFPNKCNDICTFCDYIWKKL